MKTAFTLLAVFSCVFSASAFADGWKTLAGGNSSVTLKKGETAFIVSVSQDMIVQYSNESVWPLRPVQFHLGTGSCNQGYSSHHSYRMSQYPQSVVPTTKNPFPIAGPCTITVKSNGVATMKVVSEK
jgi:hypothetical protein